MDKLTAPESKEAINKFIDNDEYVVDDITISLVSVNNNHDI